MLLLLPFLLLIVHSYLLYHLCLYLLDRHPRRQLKIQIVHLKIQILLLPDAVEERVLQGLVYCASFAGVKYQCFV